MFQLKSVNLFCVTLCAESFSYSTRATYSCEMPKLVENFIHSIPMNNGNRNKCDHLDRIERILESTAALSQQSISRLDRLEQIAQTTLSIAQKNREGIERTEQLTRRNATASVCLEERIEQYIVEGREHREFIATQVDGIRVVVCQL